MNPQANYITWIEQNLGPGTSRYRPIIPDPTSHMELEKAYDAGHWSMFASVMRPRRNSVIVQTIGGGKVEIHLIKDLNQRRLPRDAPRPVTVLEQITSYRMAEHTGLLPRQAALAELGMLYPQLMFSDADVVGLRQAANELTPNWIARKFGHVVKFGAVKAYLQENYDDRFTVFYGDGMSVAVHGATEACNIVAELWVTALPHPNVKRGDVWSCTSLSKLLEIISEQV